MNWFFLDFLLLNNEILTLKHQWVGGLESKDSLGLVISPQKKWRYFTVLIAGDFGVLQK